MYIKSLPAITSHRYFQVIAGMPRSVIDLTDVSVFWGPPNYFFRSSSMPMPSLRTVIGALGSTMPPPPEAISAAASLLTSLSEIPAPPEQCSVTQCTFHEEEDGVLLVRGTIENRGATWWYGIHARNEVTDAVGIRFLNMQGTSVSEHRVHYMYECIPPGGSISFEHAISVAESELPAGRYNVEIDIVREGVRWCTEEPRKRFSHPLSLKSPRKIRPLVYTSLASPNHIALTFDGGGSTANYTPELLSILRSHQVRCTMFLTGGFISRFPELVKTMVADGHEIGNHTLTHPPLCFDFDRMPAPQVTKDFLLQELSETERIFNGTTGSTMSKLWRAPFGYSNSLINLWGRQLGFDHISWSYDSKDWSIGPPSSGRFTGSDMIREVRSFVDAAPGGRGQILLFHLASSDSKDPTYPHLDELITYIQAKGLGISTVGSMLSMAEQR